VDHGLPRRGTRQPQADPAGNERTAERHGNHRTFRPVQSRTPDLGALRPGRDRQMVPGGALMQPMKRMTGTWLAALLVLALAGCGDEPASPAEKGVTSDVQFPADNPVLQAE